MNEFKGTKGKWEAIEHSWSDTSLYCNGKVLATQSIYEEITEENEKELESEVAANFKLISKAPEMLEALSRVSEYLKENRSKNYMIELMYREFICIDLLIKEATEV